MESNLFKSKLIAFLIHGCVSIVFAGATAALVFFIWYPGIFAKKMAGVDLFLLVLAVEVCLGPLMSLVIYNPNKPKSELLRDYSIIGVLQISALVYGLHSTFIARPIYVIYSVDRLEVVSALEIDSSDLKLATKPFSRLPKWGPRRICAELPEDKEKRSDILLSALGGKDVHLMPQYYAECDHLERLEKKGWEKQPLMQAIENIPKYHSEKVSLKKLQFRWLPVNSRFGAWIEVYPSDNPQNSFSVNIDPFELSN